MSIAVAASSAPSLAPPPAADGLEELLGEAERAAAQRVHGVVDQVVREAATPHQPDQRVVVADDVQAEGLPGLQDRRRPRVAEQHRPGREDLPADRRLPGGPGRVVGQGLQPADGVLDLRGDDVDHAVQQVFLVGDVVIERHRLDPELPGQAAHGERPEAVAVGQGDRRLEHPGAREGAPWCRARRPG
jgi:hypothetical protein